MLSPAPCVGSRGVPKEYDGRDSAAGAAMSAREAPTVSVRAPRRDWQVALIAAPQARLDAGSDGGSLVRRPVT